MLFIEKSREGHVIPIDEPKIVDIACGKYLIPKFIGFEFDELIYLLFDKV